MGLIGLGLGLQWTVAHILHAQCSAEGFYRRLGFKAQGDVFQDAGIDHIEMSLKLN
ncbi:MAG: GNAT family N-acetyltransferase [Betaproteobacteria bacterium]|nr:GNAT family N-acetyltransferase [Betaproteobacteria bacterium]